MAVSETTTQIMQDEADSAPAAGISIDSLSFAYPRHGHRLTDISLQIRQGEICCLLGPNGAGKTTLLRCLLKLLTPSAGSILVSGRNVAQLSSRQLARLVAYVPQNTSTPFPFTALDIAVMGRTPYIALSAEPSHGDHEIARAQLEELGIDHLADRQFTGLSGGERQLVLLARALVQGSPILVLDEPTSALDFGNEVLFLQIVSRLAAAGKTILMTTHQPSHALNHASRAVLMRDGTVFADGPADEVVTSKLLSDLYGVQIRVASVEADEEGNPATRICVPALQ